MQCPDEPRVLISMKQNPRDAREYADAEEDASKLPLLVEGESDGHDAQHQK
jgi:hypothetical protein